MDCPFFISQLSTNLMPRTEYNDAFLQVTVLCKDGSVWTRHFPFGKNPSGPWQLLYPEPMGKDASDLLDKLHGYLR